MMEITIYFVGMVLYCKTYNKYFEVFTNGIPNECIIIPACILFAGDQLDTHTGHLGFETTFEFRHQYFLLNAFAIRFGCRMLVGFPTSQILKG